MYKRIAIALDGSKCARQALEVALELASEQQALLGIISIVDPLFSPGAMHVNPAFNVMIRELEKAARAEVASAIAMAHDRDIAAVGETRIGNPTREILRYAEHFDADAIVMGTHGRRGFSRLLGGSVAEAVLTKAFVPVILVREEREPECAQTIYAAARRKISA